jgi:hypothetical protein
MSNRNNIFVNFSLHLSLSVLICSCAQIVAPGGGKRDTTPPKVVSYTPDSAQLNFNSKIIEITFDEYIQLKDLSNQLIISPPLEKVPDINVKNKSLSIDLGKEELKPNTTYSINFGSALQDINESNPKENFSYIFSTGDAIDSLMAEGRVQSAFDHKAEKGVLAMLYTDMSDSAVYKSAPDYFAKTDGDGNFRINNVKKGEYKIVAVKDLNNNLKYDDEAESIGFYDSLVKLSYPPKAQVDTSMKQNDSIFNQKDTLNINLNDTLKINTADSLKNKHRGPRTSSDSTSGRHHKPGDVSKKKKTIPIDLFQEQAKKVFVKKHSHPSYGKIVLAFNQGSDSIHVTNLSNDLKGVQELFDFSKNKDTLVYWIKNYQKDSLELQVKNGDTIIDTLEFKMIKLEDALKSKKSALKLRLVNNFSGNQNFDLNSDLKFIFSEPLSFIDTSQGFVFMEDTVLYKGKFPLELYRDSTLYGAILGMHRPAGLHQSSSFMDHVPLKENTKYSLLIMPGTFTDIYGLTNDSIKITFKTRELKYYGSLKLKINAPEAFGDYIIQLLDEKENLVRENYVTGKETIDYEYLYPKKYKLKMIFDNNCNLKWDSGNYLENRHAEKVIYNSDDLTIRSNWEAEIEWKINPGDN